jgi:hypothetical protein
MAKEYDKIDESYLKAYNTGYELAKELGFTSKDLDGLKVSRGQIPAIKDGMKQFEKEQAKQRVLDKTQQQERKTQDHSKDRRR